MEEQENTGKHVQPALGVVALEVAVVVGVVVVVVVVVVVRSSVVLVLVVASVGVAA
jgi:hypothetical protein